MTRRDVGLGLAAASLLLPATLAAQGHGPVYGLSTPTLGRGAWSVDATGMGRIAGDAAMIMARPMVSYGLMEDLQLSVSAPIRLYRDAGLRPARAMSRMPATTDLELTLGWRFHRQGTAVGARFESTAYVSFDYPTEATRSGVRTAPGLMGALVTGYASRAVYLWGGGLYRRYLAADGGAEDRAGDLVMYSLVVGYRPPFFREDFPNPDWRVFVEVVGEWSAEDRVSGAAVPGTGGHQIFVAPTVLGLYGRWGIAGGPAFPVFSRVNGAASGDTVRLVVNFIRWF